MNNKRINNIRNSFLPAIVQMNQERMSEFGQWHSNVALNESEIGKEILKEVYVQTEKSIYDLQKTRIKRSMTELDSIPGTSLTSECNNDLSFLFRILRQSNTCKP